MLLAHAVRIRNAPCAGLLNLESAIFNKFSKTLRTAVYE